MTTKRKRRTRWMWVGAFTLALVALFTLGTIAYQAIMNIGG
jgi:hypothetical protein